MKQILLLCSLIISFQAFTQKHKQLYDYKWKPCDAAHARFFSVVEKKENYWSRRDYFLREKKLQMIGTYEDSACKIKQGIFNYYYVNGQLKSTGKYLDDERQGLWKGYFADGSKKDSAYYERGSISGIGLSWHNNGKLADSTIQKRGFGKYFKWYDNGSISCEGQYANYKPEGTWKFYHINGQLSFKGEYSDGKLMDRKLYDEAGNESADNKSRDRQAEFPGGEVEWRKFLNRNWAFPRDYKIRNNDSAYVVVELTIAEDGSVADVEVASPLNPEIDEAAVVLYQKSPKWTPAIEFNRRVKSKLYRTVKF